MVPARLDNTYAKDDLNLPAKQKAAEMIEKSFSQLFGITSASISSPTSIPVSNPVVTPVQPKIKKKIFGKKFGDE